MHVTVDMIFEKEYIKRFLCTLSTSEFDDIIEFTPRDSFNSIIRSHLSLPPKNYKPKFGKEITKIVIPLNSREAKYVNHFYLTRDAMKSLELDMEDQFYMLYFRVEAAAALSKMHFKKDIRKHFLLACNITEDIMNEDSFRKRLDRHMIKKEEQINKIFENKNFNIASIRKSV